MLKSARFIAVAVVMILDSAMLAYSTSSAVQIFSTGPAGSGAGLFVGILGFLTFFVVLGIVIYVLFNPDGPKKQA